MDKVNAKVVKDLDFPVANVWNIVSDFGNLEWAAPGARVDVTGEGAGMIRSLHMPNAEPADELLESIDHNEHVFSYTVLRGMPLPIADFRGHVAVTPLEGNRSRIQWAASGKATPGTTGEQASAILDKLYQNLIAALEAHLQKAVR